MGSCLLGSWQIPIKYYAGVSLFHRVVLWGHCSAAQDLAFLQVFTVCQTVPRNIHKALFPKTSNLNTSIAVLLCISLCVLAPDKNSIIFNEWVSPGDITASSEEVLSQSSSLGYTWAIFFSQKTPGKTSEKHSCASRLDSFPPQKVRAKAQLLSEKRRLSSWTPVVYRTVKAPNKCQVLMEQLQVRC